MGSIDKIFPSVCHCNDTITGGNFPWTSFIDEVSNATLRLW